MIEKIIKYNMETANKYQEYLQSENGIEAVKQWELQNKPTDTPQERRYLLLIACSESKGVTVKSKAAIQKYAEKSFELKQALRYYRLKYWRNNSHNLL